LDFQVLRSSTVAQTYNVSAGNLKVVAPNYVWWSFSTFSGIVQLQLEQDSGKSLHDSGEEKSLIDLNRFIKLKI
jgi:Asp-tRNA(Asn)/Glu-tRNA(Gln) amidotransferase B subunit